MSLQHEKSQTYATTYGGSVKGRKKKERKTYLQSVLPAEALFAVAAWERLDSKVDPLVPLQVVVSVETLRALIALEGTVRLVGLVVSAQMGHHPRMPVKDSAHYLAAYAWKRV